MLNWRYCCVWWVMVKSLCICDTSHWRLQELLPLIILLHVKSSWILEVVFFVGEFRFFNDSSEVLRGELFLVLSSESFVRGEVHASVNSSVQTLGCAARIALREHILRMHTRDEPSVPGDLLSPDFMLGPTNPADSTFWAGAHCHLLFLSVVTVEEGLVWGVSAGHIGRPFLRYKHLSSHAKHTSGCLVVLGLTRCISLASC